jgi:hypothetical protein
LATARAEGPDLYPRPFFLPLFTNGGEEVFSEVGSGAGPDPVGYLAARLLICGRNCKRGPPES